MRGGTAPSAIADASFLPAVLRTVPVAGAPLVANGLVSFVVEPLGEPVAPLLKYGSNAFFALLVIALVTWGHARVARRERPERTGPARSAASEHPPSGSGRSAARAPPAVTTPARRTASPWPSP
ncbi:hypothetical protein BJF83_14620 [Nocardiopsis sp. CNR-923]|uniref:hypothetical protein n=1 Tax=Nocardiopsis sp. CNR-923 TaxID=1904965 RepID=UPI000967EBDE|nr:hypothetical protein [Nocardiopsis sp. CNR-923]OLT28719.1 hypothetical protein BJF83_14620 [Nocardiopsis sp. CNR-923]